MQLARIRSGDIVECNVLGRRFHALVDASANAGQLAVTPITKGITYRAVTARQVCAHWRRAKQGQAVTTAATVGTEEQTLGVPSPTGGER